MNKAVFLDRDGTINVEKHYLFRKEDFEFLPGVPEALKLLQEKGFLLIIVTNQSGIARGFYSEEDYIRLNDWMLSELKSKGINISGTYFCPHHPDSDIEKYRIECSCRKPAAGLFIQAAEEHDIDMSVSFAVGDKIRDCAICSTTGCMGYLIGNNEDPDVIENVKNGNIVRVAYAKDLPEAASAIVGKKS